MADNSELNLDKLLKPKALIWVIGVACVFVIAIMIGYGWFLHFGEGTKEQHGQLGDEFSLVNTFFSSIGVFLLAFTLIVQVYQIREQQKEIARTNKELKAQNRRVMKQQFETTFFNLLQLYNEVVKNIDIHKTTKETRTGKVISATVISGKDCFKFFFETFSHLYENSATAVSKPNDTSELNAVYTKLYYLYQNDLGHYFRVLYHLVKFVHNSAMKDKKRYTSIIRAQLSSHELLLLFYNGISDLGKEKFKPLIEEYQLLKSLPFDNLKYASQKDLYAARAYGINV